MFYFTCDRSFISVVRTALPAAATTKLMFDVQRGDKMMSLTTQLNRER